ncbi:hypothetical protein ABH898_004343 [Paenibacillus sp. RC82]
MNEQRPSWYGLENGKQPASFNDAGCRVYIGYEKLHVIPMMME